MSDQPRNLEPAGDDVDLLAQLEPSAEFDATALRQRIAASIRDQERVDAVLTGAEDRGPEPTGIHIRVSRASTLAWWRRGALQAAAAIALFALGLALGRTNLDEPVRRDGLTAPRLSTDLPITNAAAVPTAVPADRVALSIQNAGTGYVSSLALLSEMRAELTPNERRQAREVAVAVLAGALAELLLSGDEVEPESLLRSLAADQQGVDDAGQERF